MNKKPRLMTLADQQREKNKSLDRGKKLIGSCMLGIAVVLFTWSASYPGFMQLAIAAACIGCMVLVHLQQLKIGGLMRWILTALFFVGALYFGQRGAMIVILASALMG